MTLINDRVNLMLVICCSALISCNKVLRNFEGSNCHLFKKLSGLDDNLVSYEKKECIGVHG